MAVFVKEFSTRQEMQDLIDDIIIGSQEFDVAQKLNVAGLTLTFTTPLITITFPSTSAFEAASAREVAIEVENQSSGRMSMRMYGHGQTGRKMILILNNATDVFTGGTAAALLGLAAGTVGAAAITAANLVTAYFNSKSNSHVLVYNA